MGTCKYPQQSWSPAVYLGIYGGKRHTAPQVCPQALSHPPHWSQREVGPYLPAPQPVGPTDKRWGWPCWKSPFPASWWHAPAVAEGNGVRCQVTEPLSSRNSQFALLSAGTATFVMLVMAALTWAYTKNLLGKHQNWSSIPKADEEFLRWVYIPPRRPSSPAKPACQIFGLRKGTSLK